MNPFVLLSIVYGLMTLGSASILYFSFSEKVDTSGKYFLLSESLMILVIAQVIVTNLYPEQITAEILFIGNFIHIASEIAIFFSIFALTKNISHKKYLVGLLFAAIYSGIVEICRTFDPKLPILLVAISSAIMGIATYAICKSPPNKELSENLFLRWIRYIEIGLVCFALLRIASFFSDTPIAPRQPSTSVAILYTFFVALSVFRYISYQSLRISWVDPRSDIENLLNQNMMRLVKEKNQFLQGLISSNRAIGISALANSLAHELSQPITGVILQTESVKRSLSRLEGHDKSIGTLNTVTDQLNRLSDLVNNLRRVFSGKGSEFHSVNIQNACDEILEIIEPTLKSENIQLRKQYQSSPHVLGNTIQIQQVLINLFNNAIDAVVSSNSQVREITLTVSEGDSFALVSIQDSGNGISKEVKTSLFEIYQTTKKDGIGIGLWLCKEIIEMHEGSIHASNTSQAGAIFEIRLPLSNHLNGDT